MPNAELFLLLKKCADAQLYSADISTDALTHTIYSNGSFGNDPLASAAKLKGNSARSLKI
jgi:hypothetical protein